MIKIPNNFKLKLEESNKCNSSVLKTIEIVTPKLENNKLIFFPEYTNHGIKHMNSVMILAERIIEKETFNNLSCEDIEALIESILLHDLGMHISYAGFLFLLNSNKYNKDNIYNDISWKELWDKYLIEAKKWNYEKQKNVFGTIVKIEDLPNDELQLNTVHILLIGEFLRRYHHKLAYDIAIFGFPGDNKSIDCIGTDNEDKRKIVAHISRSHGMNLWEMLDLMEKEYENCKAVYNVKLLYNMAVLRIADYFDIDRERANVVVLNIQRINSELSKIEWEKHNCIDEIDMDYQEDKESIYIRLSPPNNSKIYLEINELINNLQVELDNTWAVIGKVYARYNKLEIAFRRVHSNLSRMASKVNYVAKKVSFDVERNILFSLSQPLYGGNPSYGIRELLQNAIDACEERSYHEEKDYISKVSILIEYKNDTPYIHIKDNGIGMDEDVILNCFLIAGSSYRKSLEWKEKYVVEDEIVVLRNGKFGIGVLAAFLLGAKIKVVTTPFNQNIQYEFEASLDMKQIELYKSDKITTEVGTEIVIESTNEIISLLKNQWKKGWNDYNYRIGDVKIPWYEWYKFEVPHIDIKVPIEWGENKIEYIVSKEKSQNNNWFSFSTKEYERIDWNYNYNKYDKKYRLLCNGLIIPNAFRLEGYDFPRDIEIPIVSVIDREGRFPLNLNRNGIEDNRLPFEKDLIVQIYEDILDKLISMKETTTYSEDTINIGNSYLEHPAIGSTYYYAYVYGMRIDDLIFNKEGYCLCYECNLKKFKVKEITKIWVETPISIEDKKVIGFLGDNIMISTRDIPNGIDSYKFCLDINFLQELGDGFWFYADAIIIKAEKYKYLFANEKNRMRSGFRDTLKVIKETKEWMLLARKEKKIDVDLDILERLKGISLIVKYHFEEKPELYKKEKIEKSNILSELITKRFGDKIFIPYSSVSNESDTDHLGR